VGNATEPLWNMNQLMHNFHYGAFPPTFPLPFVSANEMIDLADGFTLSAFKTGHFLWKEMIISLLDIRKKFILELKGVQVRFRGDFPHSIQWKFELLEARIKLDILTEQ